MCSARDNVALPTLGFPIRESAVHWPFSASPRLIAAVHALHRLLVPRHPPCALNILTVILGRALWLHPVIPVSLATVQFSRSAKRQNTPRGGPGHGPASRRQHAGLSKLNSIRGGLPARSARSSDLPGPVDVLVADHVAGERRRARELAHHEQSSWRTILLVDRCPLVEGLPRKEVIQPQLPLRLPCYDFTPVASPTFDGTLQKVRQPASGVAHSHGVTGGVYKARERIHRGSADPRLLATPPSCRRVSACNPNRDAL